MGDYENNVNLLLLLVHVNCIKKLLSISFSFLRQYGGPELTNMKTPLIFSRPSVAGELLSFSLQLESDSSLLRIHLLSRLSM
jgi:hypothetical protein